MTLFFLNLALADKAIKNVRTVPELLSLRPPEGSASLHLEWEDSVTDLPVLRMVTGCGPFQDSALDFRSLSWELKRLRSRCKVCYTGDTIKDIPDCKCRRSIIFNGTLSDRVCQRRDPAIYLAPTNRISLATST